MQWYIMQTCSNPVLISTHVNFRQRDINSVIVELYSNDLFRFSTPTRKKTSTLSMYEKIVAVNTRQTWTPTVQIAVPVSVVRDRQNKHLKSTSNNCR